MRAPRCPKIRNGEVAAEVIAERVPAAEILASIEVMHYK